MTEVNKYLAVVIFLQIPPNAKELSTVRFVAHFDDGGTWGCQIHLWATPYRGVALAWMEFLSPEVIVPLGKEFEGKLGSTVIAKIMVVKRSEDI